MSIRYASFPPTSGTSAITYAPDTLAITRAPEDTLDYCAICIEEDETKNTEGAVTTGCCSKTFHFTCLEEWRKTPTSVISEYSF